MSWQGKSVLVVGLGRSGRAAATELARLGAKVTACDRQALAEEELENLRKEGVHLILGGYPEVNELQPDLVITSPGVPSGEPPWPGPGRGSPSGVNWNWLTDCCLRG